MKNYIINGSPELINIASQQFGIPKVCISNKEHLNLGSKHSYRATELFDCKYDISLKDLDPIDSVLLDKLEKCEISYLKMCDRINTYGGYQKRKDDYLSHVRYWNHVVKNEDIDFVIFLNVPHEGYDFVLYSICKVLNIKTFSFFHLPHRPGFTFIHLLEDINHHLPEIKKSYQDLKNRMIDITISDIAKPLNLFLIEQLNPTNEITPFTGQEKGFSSNGFKYIHTKIFNLMSSLKKDSQQSFSKKISNFVNGVMFRDPYLDSPRSVMKKYDSLSVQPDLTKEFIYFPLHYQPELSTNPLGGHYVNQLIVVEMLSKANPDLMIYVKDHPRSGNIFKNKIFYESLLKFKNVNLINLNFNSYKLIEDSYAVATVTGTAGLEALIKGKPVLMFGNRFYEHAPGVFKINSFNDLKKATRIINEGFSFDQKNVLYFFKALENYVFEGVMDTSEESYSNITHSETAKKMIAIINQHLI